MPMNRRPILPAGADSPPLPGLRRPGRRRWWALLAALSVVFALGAPGTPPAGAAAPDVDGDTLVVVVGDLVPGPGGSLANAQAVHDVAVRQGADAYVFPGDLQYERGELANYQNRWDPIWGDEFSRSYPAAGNHEYGNGANSGWAATGGGYFDYWGARARPSAASYYSFDVNLPAGGHWHVVVLNSACGRYDNPPQWYTPSCSLTGAMEDWLRVDLAADDAQCELAVFHEPAFATKAPSCRQHGDAHALVDDGGTRRRPGRLRPQPRLRVLRPAAAHRRLRLRQGHPLGDRRHRRPQPHPLLGDGGGQLDQANRRRLRRADPVAAGQRGDHCVQEHRRHPLDAHSFGCH